jgi:hypothetical protein
MSTSQIIYNNILNSTNFSGSVSPDVQEYHKSIINVFLNYQSGSSTVNLWDKLDFFYFFDTDNESLRFINWVDPNTPTASIQNDNFPLSYNYSYLGPAQDQIAKWWDGKTTPIGNKNSSFNDGTLTYAWSASTAQPVERADASGSIGGGIKQFVLTGNVPTNGTGSLPDTYVNTLTQTFTYYPFTSSYSYQYGVNNGYIISGSFSFYLQNQVAFSNITNDTSTYNGVYNFRSSSFNNPYSGISVQVLQNPLRHQITITAPQYPPSRNPIVTSLVNSLDTFNSRTQFPFVDSYVSLFNSRLFGTFNSNYYTNLLQDWILNNNYLIGKVGAFQRYPNYYQVLSLNNGSYFNTNVNIKQKSDRKYQLNDGFIGFLKMGPGGGVTFNTSYNTTQSGSLYVGVIESENSNNSLAVKVNKQYFQNATGSNATDFNTGFQAGLGRSITSSYKEIDYVWKAYTGSNPFPYSSSALGNQDIPSSEVTASNASSRAGRPGLYIAQRYTSSIVTANIKQYFNNLEAVTTTLGIDTGSIPDGNFYLNGVSSPTYVDENYVNASNIQFITKSLANITSVNSGSFFGTATYTSSALISNIIGQSTNVLTYTTGAYDPQTGFGVDYAQFSNIPSSTTLNQDFYIGFSIENQFLDLPNTGDLIHIGYDDNQIGYVTVVQKVTDSESNFISYYVYGTATKTTGSGINSGNSTIVRFYEGNYINVGSTFNSRSRQTLYSTVISGSGLYTTSSTMNNSFLLGPNSSQVINYPFNGINGFPTQSISITSGSEIGLVISSSVPIFDTAGPGVGWQLAFPFGNQTYTGPEFGTTYFTRFTGSYVTSSNELETIFITDNIGNVVYDNNTFLSNGSYTLAEPSVSGSAFNFQYSGSTQISLLSGLSTSNLFKITILNPEYESSYFTPDGQDLKQYDKQSEQFILAFAGGGINSTNLKFLYKQLYDLIFARSVYKQSFIPIINFEPFVLGADGYLYYTSYQAIQNIYPQPVNVPPYIPNTKDAKTTWNAVTDVQSNFVGIVNLYGTTLINPFNI